MADNINFSSNRASTGRLGSLNGTGRLDPTVANQAPVADPTIKKAKTDTLRLSDAAGAASPVDAASVRDLAEKVGAVQNEQKQVSELQARINSLVPGGVKFETSDGASWSSTELKNLQEVVEGMSPSDRQALSGMNFVRAGKVDLADGANASTEKQVGEGFTDGGAMASARTQGESKGVMGRLGEFARHSAEVLEGIPILRYIGRALKSLFGQQAPERAIVFGNSGTMISKQIWAHEIGHQVQMVNRGWNPEKIAEFAKLSGWTETYGNKQYAADGVDNRTGERMNFDEQVLKAGRSDNFVSKYAMTSPTEDFAESYQAFLNDPKKLMEQAPEKFLFINAQSQKYSASEVKGYAQQAGQDLDTVATELMLNSGLKQETLNSLLTVNGVAPDKGALLSDAASHLTSGDALSQAWAKIATDAKDPQGAARLLADPASTLGEVWNKLAPDEQALLKDQTFMQARLNELQGGFASYRSSADATETELYREGTKALVDRLMNDPAYRQTLAQDPAQALTGLHLPPEVVEAFTHNPGAVSKFTQAIGELMDHASAEEKSRYQANLLKALPQLGPEHFGALAMALNNPKDEGLAGKMVKQALETGSVVYQGGGEPPFA
ncbi:MAG TPA: hypothetical protein V6D05_07445 [Stenomitos sp.]